MLGIILIPERTQTVNKEICENCKFWNKNESADSSFAHCLFKGFRESTFSCEKFQSNCSKIPNSSEEKHIPFTHEDLKTFIQEKENEIGLKTNTCCVRNFSVYLDLQGNICPIWENVIVLCDKLAKTKEDLKFFVLDQSEKPQKIIEFNYFKKFYSKIKDFPYGGYAQRLKDKAVVVSGLDRFISVNLPCFGEARHIKTDNKYEVTTIAYSLNDYCADKDKNLIINNHPFIQKNRLYVVYNPKNESSSLNFLRPLPVFEEKFEIDVPSILEGINQNA